MCREKKIAKLFCALSLFKKIRHKKNYDWYYDVYKERKGLTNSEILTLDFRENGEHKHIYNKFDIKKLLIECGFKEKNISFYKPFESDKKYLKNVEKRKNSVCVEAVK